MYPLHHGAPKYILPGHNQLPPLLEIPPSQNTISDEDKIINYIFLIQKQRFVVPTALLLMKEVFLLAVSCGGGISLGGFKENYHLCLVG
jgi:hypothetical protein